LELWRVWRIVKPHVVGHVSTTGESGKSIQDGWKYFLVKTRWMDAFCILFIMVNLH
jgi:hypothetical protein